MKRFFNKKVVAIGLAVGITLGIGGAAFAYFTASGSGTGTATVGTATGLTIVQEGTITDLLSGGPSQPIEYTIDNTTAGNEDITGVTVSISSVTGGSNSPSACTSADFTLVQPLQVPGDIGPGVTFDSTNPGPSSGASIAMTDNGNQDGCEGATVNLSFAATA